MCTQITQQIKELQVDFKLHSLMLITEKIHRTVNWALYGCMFYGSPKTLSLEPGHHLVHASQKTSHHRKYSSAFLSLYITSVGHNTSGCKTSLFGADSSILILANSSHTANPILFGHLLEMSSKIKGYGGLTLRCVT